MCKHDGHQLQRKIAVYVDGVKTHATTCSASLDDARDYFIKQNGLAENRVWVKYER